MHFTVIFTTSYHVLQDSVFAIINAARLHDPDLASATQRQAASASASSASPPSSYPVEYRQRMGAAGPQSPYKDTTTPGGGGGSDHPSCRSFAHALCACVCAPSASSPLGGTSSLDTPGGASGIGASGGTAGGSKRPLLEGGAEVLMALAQDPRWEMWCVWEV